MSASPLVPAAAEVRQPSIPTPALEFRPILPEMLLCAFAIVGMLYEAFARRPDPAPHLAIATVGIVAAAVTAYSLWDWSGAPYVLGDTVAVDRFSVVARFLLLGAALVGCLYSPITRPAIPHRSEGSSTRSRCSRRRG